MVKRPQRSDSGPLGNLEQWEDDLRRRYPDPNRLAPESSKTKDQFRDYRAEVRPEVKEFYRLNHKHQTVEFVRAKRAEFLKLDKRRMGLWDGLEFLNTLVDDSDPDTRLPQIEHLLQTAEAIRRDGHPRWFILTGLIHDFGKVLCLFGEPQWAVVGDTFPVGCAFSDKIVFAELLGDNPDSRVPEYQTPCGIYEEGCGLDKVLMSWGHDEYMYHVVKDYLPPEALYDQDRKYFAAVRAFNPYDLYTKAAERPDVERLRPFYEELWNEFLPRELAF
jgi:inositol oxygenase